MAPIRAHYENSEPFTIVGSSGYGTKSAALPLRVERLVSNEPIAVVAIYWSGDGDVNHGMVRARILCAGSHRVVRSSQPRPRGRLRHTLRRGKRVLSCQYGNHASFQWAVIGPCAAVQGYRCCHPT
jgi:hypothetical protein